MQNLFDVSRAYLRKVETIFTEEYKPAERFLYCLILAFGWPISFSIIIVSVNQNLVSIPLPIIALVICTMAFSIGELVTYLTMLGSDREPSPIEMIAQIINEYSHLFQLLKKMELAAFIGFVLIAFEFIVPLYVIKRHVIAVIAQINSLNLILITIEVFLVVRSMYLTAKYYPWVQE